VLELFHAKTRGREGGNKEEIDQNSRKSPAKVCGKIIFMLPLVRYLRQSRQLANVGRSKADVAQSGCVYLFASDTIRKGDGYRTPVIPAVLLSRNPVGFSEVIMLDPVTSISQGDRFEPQTSPANIDRVRAVLKLH
jgi:hypothetical protein